MKKSVSKRIASAFVAGVLMVSPIISSVTASAAKVLTTSPSHTQEVGWYNDYHHEIWQADTPNSSTMTLHDNDGGFSTSWKCGPNGSRGNFLARRGLYWGLNNPKTYKDYGDFYCDYDCNWQAGSSGNSRICIYGWAQNPLVEYYIIEDWKNWSPAQDSSAQYKGSVNIDGSEYKIYTSARNSYTIEGNKNFTQYISIRQNLRTKGTISVSEHFKAWESKGLKMGNLYEVAFNVEGWESDGSADVNLKMYEGKSGYTPDPDPDPNPEIEGTLYSATFENGTNSWSGRGSASVTSSSSAAYEGSKSLYVSGRTDNWNGGEMDLNTSTFKPGSAYSFSAMVNPTESTTLQLTMQYDDQSGTTNYTQIAEGSCTAGKWSKLENTSFTIPSGASNVKVYVEAPDSLCDFYVDRAIIASKGYTAEGSTPGGTGSTSATVPSNVKVAYSSQYKQLQFTWDKVKGADKYGIAVYLAGKWRVQNSNISSNSYVTPKNLTPNMSYKVAIAARVNGKWDTAGALENYVTVTTRAYNNIEYHTPSNTNNNGGNNGGNNNGGNNNGGNNNGGNNTQQQPNGYYVDPSKPMVAISFDDGTAQGYSGQRIIDALYKNGFHATFFYVGNWIGKPDQVRDAYSKGMEIANHTMSHPNLTEKNASQIRSEYDNCASKLKSIIGAEPSKLLRLPYLASNWQVQQTLNDVPLITCAIDTQDWNGASAYQIENTIKNAANNGSLNGAIVLCHETYDNTATAMESVLPWLKSQGYQVVTISEMFAAKGKTLNGGQIYTKVS